MKPTSGDPHIFESFDKDDATYDGYIGENDELVEAFLNGKEGFDISSIINKDYIRLRAFQMYRCSEVR